MRKGVGLNSSLHAALVCTRHGFTQGLQAQGGCDGQQICLEIADAREVY